MQAKLLTRIRLQKLFYERTGYLYNECYKLFM